MRVTGVDWWLDVHYREKSFEGRVRIAFEESDDPFVLDCAQLALDSPTLDGAPVQVESHPDRGTVSIAGVSPGSHVFEVKYRGTAASDSLVGMYVAPAGPEYVLTTMLFPTGSGRLLPSFEHPAVKTVYRLTLRTDPELRVIFNTAPRGERLVDGRREIEFGPTPPMSAYLLYLGIGPFDTLTLSGGRWSVTVASSPGRASTGRYCGERATEMLAAYEEYYGIPYPLSKLDLVALENFWAGAMENWGAIAFRDVLVLTDATTSVESRRRNLCTLAHEIAHQWFGNLVTNAWWDDFWLNESFATFVGYRIVDRRYPSEEAWQEMVLRWISSALDMDALDSTHPVRVPVTSPQELGENADYVTYGKGAAVLRMIESYLGEETFRRGIARYLERHRYANATSFDLWNALGDVSDRPVPRIMTEWITRPGYPIIRARVEEGRLALRQERFRADGGPSPAVWPIPLRIQGSGAEQRVLFETAEASYPIGATGHLRVDPGRHSFVRIFYEGALFDAMLAEFPTMEPLDQWGFINDLGAFAYAGLVPGARVLGLVAAGVSLTHELPVRGLLSLVGELRRVLSDLPAYTDVARGFVTAQLDRVGVEERAGEPRSHAGLRELLVNVRTELDLDFARALARRYPQFDALPPSLRQGVAVAHARTGGLAACRELTERLRATSSAGERIQMLIALGKLEDPEALREALGLIPSPGVPASDAYVLLRSMGTNPAAGEVVFDWYRGRISALTEMWRGTPLQSELLEDLVIGMGIGREAAVRAFFADHTPPDAVSGTARGLESLRLAMRLREATIGRSTS